MPSKVSDFWARVEGTGLRGPCQTEVPWSTASRHISLVYHQHLCPCRLDVPLNMKYDCWVFWVCRLRSRSQAPDLRAPTCLPPRSFAHLWWARLGLWSAISVRAAHLVVWTGRRESACLLASDAYPSFKSSMIHVCHTSSLSHFILHALAYLYNRSAECMLVCLPYLFGRW